MGLILTSDAEGGSAVIGPGGAMPGQDLPDHLTGGIAKPWGLWQTLGLSLLVILVYFALSGAVVLLFMAFGEPQDPSLDVEALVRMAGGDGLTVCVSLVVAGLSGSLLVILLSRGRPGFTAKSYLNLVGAPPRYFVVWISLTVIFLFGFHLLSTVVEFQKVDTIYAPLRDTAVFLPLFVFAFAAMPALFEEILFRGFMFRGLQATRLGNIGAIVVTSLTWSVIHLQYSMGLVAVLFALGLLFGVARVMTGSVVVAMVMHGIFNLISVSQLILLN